jgi:hypothetical protein
MKKTKKQPNTRKQKGTESLSNDSPHVDATIPTEGKEVTCRECQTTYVPSFANDFYPDGADPKVGLCERCLITGVLAPKQPTDIPDGHEVMVCKFGKGQSTCAFMILSSGSGGLRKQCAKGSHYERIIRDRLEKKSMGAKGDNCSGPPDFTATKA